MSDHAELESDFEILPDERTIRFQTVLRNIGGLHARPAALLAELCSRFRSHILIQLDHRTADAKSILDMMVLPAEKGNTLTFVVNGPDAELAARAILRLIQIGFTEKSPK